MPTPHRLTADVTGGLEGVARIVTLLRARRYDVPNLSAEITPDGVAHVTWEIGTSEDLDLLLRRLERMPAIVDVTIETPAVRSA